MASTAFAGAARIVDLEADYNVVRTVLHTFDPANHPDMDGDGQPDLEGQMNIETLLDILADPSHPLHASTLAVFELNESIGTAALRSRYPTEPFVPYMAEVLAVYMTIQGPGTYAGPTMTGMAGLVEFLWNKFEFDDTIGPFESQEWTQSDVFAIASTSAQLAATGGGVVNRGDRVVLAVVPAGALAYAWYKNEQPLPEHTSAAIVFDPVDFDDAGSYYCEVTTADNANLQTPTVVLTVNEPPALPGPSLAPQDALLLLIVTASTRFARRIGTVRS